MDIFRKLEVALNYWPYVSNNKLKVTLKYFGTCGRATAAVMPGIAYATSAWKSALRIWSVKTNDRLLPKIWERFQKHGLPRLRRPLTLGEWYVLLWLTGSRYLVRCYSAPLQQVCFTLDQELWQWLMCTHSMRRRRLENWHKFKDWDERSTNYVVFRVCDQQFGFR